MRCEDERGVMSTYSDLNILVYIPAFLVSSCEFFFFLTSSCFNILICELRLTRVLTCYEASINLYVYLYNV